MSCITRLLANSLLGAVYPGRNPSFLTAGILFGLGDHLMQLNTMPVDVGHHFTNYLGVPNIFVDIGRAWIDLIKGCGTVKVTKPEAILLHYLRGGLGFQGTGQW